MCVYLNHKELVFKITTFILICNMPTQSKAQFKTQSFKLKDNSYCVYSNQALFHPSLHVSLSASVHVILTNCYHFKHSAQIHANKTVGLTQKMKL